VLHTYPLTIPANTLADTPVEEEIHLTHGVITHVEVEFHPGCNGMVKGYVRDGLHQLFPTNPDGKYYTDGGVISWSEYHELFKSPYKLTIGGYSPGTSYDHEIIFRFEVTPREVAERGLTQDTVLANLLKLLGVRR